MGRADTLRNMTSHLPKTLLLFVTALAGLAVSAPAALIAEWNFSSGSSADLTSNVGSYTFVRSVAGNTPVYTPGAMSLDQYTGLFASGLNSTALPALKTSATIYLRLKVDSTPNPGAGFYFGFLNATAAADWNQMTLTGWTYNGVNTGGYFATDNPAVLGGEASSLFPAVGEYYTIALTAAAGTDQFGNANPNKTRLQTYVNGVLANTLALPLDSSTAGQLNNFQSFALGQLKASGGVADFTFDTVQVYDTVLTAAQIAAIPEPSTAVLLVGAGLLAVRRIRRSAR